MTPTTEAFDPKKPKKIEPGSELHFALLATPMGWNFLTGKDYADMQAFAKAVWDAATERAAKQEREDATRLDWIIRQADEFSCAVIVDAPGDGDYIVHGMDGWGQGKTAREAIDNAMQFNGAAAIRASGGKGDAS